MNSSDHSVTNLIQTATQFLDAGHWAEAEACMKRALHANPDNVDTLTSCGLMLLEMRKPGEALTLFRRILTMNPSLPDIWHAAGVCLQMTGSSASAIGHYQRAVKLRPEFAEAHSNLGTMLIKEGEICDAIGHLRRSVQIHPETAAYRHNLGVALCKHFEYAAAIVSFRDALQLDPGNADILGSLGDTLAHIHDCSAEDFLQRAVELRPDSPEKHWNLALHLLRCGKYTEGWREYEWRWLRPENPPVAYPQPLWRGEPGQHIASTTIFLHAEQGFGDTMQFLRYVPAVVALGAHVMLGVQRRLWRLVMEYLRQMQSPIPVFCPDDTLPPFDWHTPLMSLPLALGTTMDTVPSPIRFTPTISNRTDRQPLRVGIAWAGNPSNKGDQERSIPTDALMPLFNVPGCLWISLQIDDTVTRLRGAGISIEQPTQQDFLDTAHVIDTLDVVISVDTAVAHLAASQGVDTWILLSFVADWRWLHPSGQIVGPGGPWYPRARIFRQQKLPDGRSQSELWEPVIAEVARALSAAAASRDCTCEQPSSWLPLALLRRIWAGGPASGK
jgi:Flp pilus assembly protein TadD